MSKELEDMPWFTVIGALTLLSLFLKCTGLPEFTSVLLPIYVTEALLYIAVGLAFYKGYGGMNWTVFMMACIWFTNQALTWTGVAGLGSLLWLLFLAQIGLAYTFFTRRRVTLMNPFDPSSKAWAYAGLLVIMFFALAKFMLNLMYGTPLLQMFAWSLAILLTSAGYIFHKNEYSTYMKIFGTLIAAYSALTIPGAGLTLLSI